MILVIIEAPTVLSVFRRSHESMHGFMDKDVDAKAAR